MVSAPAPHLHEKRRLIAIGGLLIFLVVAATAIASWVFYQEAVSNNRDWLQNIAATQANLMATVTGYVPEHFGGGDQEATGQIISQLMHSDTKEPGFGETGEFVVGRRNGDTIEFLLHQRLAAGKKPEPVPYASKLAEPMRLALAGKEGTVIALDYRGAEVLAGFSPIGNLDLGLVAKIDLAELQNPLLKAGLVTGSIMVGIMLIGMVLMRRLSGPIIHNLEDRADKLEKLTRDLAQSNKDLEQFAYVASHDLKSPLRGIENLVDWLTEDLEGKLDEKNQRYLELLKGRSERMDALLDGLLEYSRVGRKNQTVKRVDTGAMIADIWDLMAPPSMANLTLAQDLPVFDTPEIPLELVFRNLINNAVKHHDRKDVNIVVDCSPVGSFYRFTVQDDGPGIAPEFQERIFGIFQTLKSRDEVEGSGMGLALVKRTVEFYGGTVEIRSNPGQGRGSTFCFTWPR